MGYPQNSSLENYTFSENGTDLYAEEVGRIMRNIELGHRIFIIAFGTFGNCLSVVVFSGKHLRHLSSSFYLSALAVSDTGFLLVLFVNLLQAFGIIILSDVPCRLENYLTTVFSFMSVWFVVAFTVERFIAVQYPLLRPSMCTVSRARIVICGLSMAGLVLYIPYLATEFKIEEHSQTNSSHCTPKFVTQLDSVMNGIDLVVTLIIPSGAIVSINTCICMTVHRLSRRRRRMTLNGGRACRLQLQPPRPTSQNNKVTRLLLVVSTVFISLNLPSYLFRLLLHIPGTEDIYSTLIFHIVSRVSYMLYYTNFGVNFVLYCVTGQNFRKSLLRLFFPRTAKYQDTTKVTVVSECGPAPSTRRHTITLNGSLREAHEMLPLNR